MMKIARYLTHQIPTIWVCFIFCSILNGFLILLLQDPEVVSVSLQSSDIIGLGFNISGSMSEGIFVSQVHNRGPASESGKIKVGKMFLGFQFLKFSVLNPNASTLKYI